MRLLAIETATRLVGCALWEDGALVGESTLVAGGRHAEVLMPAVDDLCRRAGTGPTELDAVAVDVGPGLFTGLRVGLATATALAAARHLPAAGVTSLEALAYPHRRWPGTVAAVVDARRGEVFWAAFRGDGAALHQLTAPQVAAPGDLAGALSGLAAPVLAVGDGAWRYRDELGPGGRGAAVELGGPGEQWPSPRAVAELGEKQLRSGRALVPPAPLYLRQADVRPGWDEVAGRVGAGGAGRPSPGANLGT